MAHTEADLGLLQHPKMERFMIIVNGFQRSILDVAAVLDLSLAQLLLRNILPA